MKHKPSDTIEISVSIERITYDYLRQHSVDVNKVVNELLKNKYKLGKYFTKPSSALPVDESIKLAIHQLKTDIHSPESLLVLVNYIISIYPFLTEADVMPKVGKIIKDEHRYDRFI